MNYIILIVLFFVTCTSKRSADDGMMYPEKMNLEFIINIAEYFGLEVNKLFLLNFGE